MIPLSFWLTWTRDRFTREICVLVKLSIIQANVKVQRAYYVQEYPVTYTYLGYSVEYRQEGL